MSPPQSRGRRVPKAGWRAERWAHPRAETGCLTAGLTGTFTAGLHVGRQVDPAQPGSGVARVEQPARWHVGVRHTAGRGAVVTAGGLKEADVVRAGAGQADPTAAALVRGADGGGGARGDAAAAGDTASHGGGNLWFLLV